MANQYGYTERTKEIMAKLTMSPEEYDEFMRKKKERLKKSNEEHSAYMSEVYKRQWEEEQRLKAQKAEEERLANCPVHQEQQRIKSLSESGETLFDSVDDHYKVAVYESDQYIANEQRKIKEKAKIRQQLKKERSISSKIKKMWITRMLSHLIYGSKDMWRSRGWHWLRFSNWFSLVLPYYLVCGGLILLGLFVIGVPTLAFILFFWPDSIIIHVLLDIIEWIIGY